MEDQLKTQSELIAELQSLRAQVQRLEGAATPGAAAEHNERLREQQEVLLRLALSPELIEADMETAVELITEAAGDCLSVERTSIWRSVDDLATIRCVDLFQRTGRTHSHGVELRARDYPAYFGALAKERTIAAHDAHTDPRTSELSESYMTPLGIGSLLDSPIRVGGHMLGVVCHEHVGSSRVWSQEEQSFAGSIGDLVSLAFAWEQRRRLEFKVFHAQKLESLGVLAGGIAHDFNNLLVGVMGNADLALRDAEPDSPMRTLLGDIEIAAKRAGDLCHQLLAYSGRGRFVIEPIDLNAVVREMGHLLEVPCSGRATPTYELADSVPAVEADATQVRQVIMNLMTNAAEALGEQGGAVTIRTGVVDCDSDYLESTHLGEQLPAGTYVFVEVADSGCGMTQTDVGRIFDPFFTSKSGGRGLGLAAIEGIVRGHKGAIKVATQPGVGTRFKVLFPRVAAAAPRVDSKPASDENSWRGSGTVLLVDDDRTARVVGQRMLELLGFQVVTAIDGRDAVEQFRRDPAAITCLVLDVVMPEMSGQEAFREVRALRSDVPVVVCSGYAEQEALREFKGLVGFLKKPYLMAELREKLRLALEDQRRTA